MLIRHGEFYLGEGDREALEALAVDEAYVRRRYDAVKLLLQPNPVGTARQVAGRFGVSRRTVQRWMARYRARGLGGLREDSRRPRRIRRKVTAEDEAALLTIRRRTGFGPNRIKALLDAARRHDPEARTYSKRTIHKVLQRHGIVEAQRKALRAWRTFEWGRPRDLVQLDLTALGPVPIATAVDDHSRRLWADPMEAETDDEVFAWMEGRVPRFRNLLTDNGSQFDRANGRAREYCYAAGTRHIWATKGHPQTLGKVSRAQQDLKAPSSWRGGRTARTWGARCPPTWGSTTTHASTAGRGRRPSSGRAASKIPPGCSGSPTPSAWRTSSSGWRPTHEGRGV